MILKILLGKAVLGVLFGLVIDFILRKSGRKEHAHIHDICEQEHCHCEKGILRSAFSHTVQISLFILVITFALNLALYFAGEDVLAQILQGSRLVGPLLAGLVGLIPNCAGSVAITQLYLSGIIGIGSLFSGLLAGSGIGLLVLFRVNHDKKENLKILGLLYAIGVVTGILMEFLFG